MTIDIIELSDGTNADFYDRFVDGAVLKHPDGTVVRFDDDVWITHPNARSKSRDFEEVAEWMKSLGKRVIAYAWLIEDKSASTLSSYAVGLRTASEVLSSFAGPADALNPDHAEAVRTWVVRQWEARQRAVFALGEQLEHQPTEKDIRSLGQREGSGRGEGSLRVVVTVLQKVVKAAEAGGLRVDCRFTFPKLLDRTETAVGSAAPEKQLSHDQVASLITAALADVEAYLDLADELHGQVREIVEAARDPKAILSGNTRASKAARRLYRYFGLGGSPMESAKQIARDEGVTAAGFTRTLHNALVRAVGEDDAFRLMNLRKRATGQGRSGSNGNDHAAVRAEIRGYFRDHPLDYDVGNVSLKDGAATIAKLVGLDCPIHSHSDAGVPSEGMVEARLIAVCGLVYGADAAKKEARALWRRRALLPTYLDRAIKACGLLLQIVCYRRISALVDSLRADLEGTWAFAPNGDRVYEVRVTAGKMWGPRGLPETIPVPGYFGEVAEQALRTVKELTAPLRSHAAPEDQHVLLLTRGPGRSWLEPTPIRPSALRDYLNNNVGRDGGGLVKRRGLEDVDHVLLHFFRHTAGSSMITEGGSAIAVADLLGNTPGMAAKFYFVGGSAEQRDQAKTAAERDATTGFLTDAVVRIAHGPEGGEKYPSQLPYDVALQRIQDTPEFVQDYLAQDGSFGPEQARSLLEAGLVINLTAWGGCLLPAEEGFCPALHSCPVGCDPERNQEDPNCGCRWGVKIPHSAAVSSYEESITMMEVQLEKMSDQHRYAVFAGPLEKRMLIHEVQLETLYHLQGATTEGVR